MFIDEARIRIKAGDGGNGCMAFRREKFVPRGGPSGGDGGRGGDIIMESSQRHNTLVHFRFNPEHKAQRGRHGEGSNCSGQEGESIVLKVPVGTIVYDEDTNQLVHDFSRPDERIVVAKGGRGGRGNQHFATSTHQAPREHELGFPGEERKLRLELKLLADVGIIGYPNVGKSTLISRISAAKPKIADYPFTTLQPNLGVVTVGDISEQQSFVVADIPGIIEGAHTGSGLGIQFLRHVERTRLLVHLVDVSDASGRPDPVQDYEIILRELKSFGASLQDKPTLVAGSKMDAVNRDKLAKLERYCRKQGLRFFPISAVTGEGIAVLQYEMARLVRAAQEEEIAAVPTQEAPVETRASRRAARRSAPAGKATRRTIIVAQPAAAKQASAASKSAAPKGKAAKKALGAKKVSPKAASAKKPAAPAKAKKSAAKKQPSARSKR